MVARATPRESVMVMVPTAFEVISDCPCGRRRKFTITVEASAPDRAQAAPRSPDLEAQILLLAAQGLTDREIARELRIGFDRVRREVRKILLRLSAKNKTEAVARALTSGELLSEDV